MRALLRDGFNADRNRGDIAGVTRDTMDHVRGALLPRTMYAESRGMFKVTSTIPDNDRQVATLRDLTRRVQAEYAEMPGLSVTLPQAQRLLGIDRETCVVVIRTLVDRRFLRCTPQGRYVRF
jgi:hypothetical protein